MGFFSKLFGFPGKVITHAPEPIDDIGRVAEHCGSAVGDVVDSVTEPVMDNVVTPVVDNVVMPVVDNVVTPVVDVVITPVVDVFRDVWPW